MYNILREHQVLLSAERSPGSCQTLDTHTCTRWLFLEMNQRPGEDQVTCHKISAASYIECLFIYTATQNQVQGLIASIK